MSKDNAKPVKADTAKPEAAEAAQPFTGKLSMSRFALAEQKRAVYVIFPEMGVPYAAILNDPSFLSHVASRLRPFDRIEVIAEDGSYFAELLVRSAGRQHARLVELNKVDMEPLQAEVDPRFSVVYAGPHRKNAVVRLRDKTTLKDGFDTAEDANAWLLANVKTLAA